MQKSRTANLRNRINQARETAESPVQPPKTTSNPTSSHAKSKPAAAPLYPALTKSELDAMDRETAPLFCDHPEAERIRFECDLMVRAAGSTTRSRDVRCHFILLDNAIVIKQQLGMATKDMSGSFSREKPVMLGDAPCSYIKYKDISQLWLRSGEGCSFSVVVAEHSVRNRSQSPRLQSPNSSSNHLPVRASPPISPRTAAQNAVGSPISCGSSSGAPTPSREPPYVTFEASGVSGMYDAVESLRGLVDRARQVRARKAKISPVWSPNDPTSPASPLATQDTGHFESAAAVSDVGSASSFAHTAHVEYPSSIAASQMSSLMMGTDGEALVVKTIRSGVFFPPIL